MEFLASDKMLKDIVIFGFKLHFWFIKMVIHCGLRCVKGAGIVKASYYSAIIVQIGGMLIFELYPRFGDIGELQVVAC